MRFDANALRRTSEADYVPWRAREVTLIRLREDGRITQAQGITEKREALREANPEDCLLLAWPGQYRQDVFLMTIGAPHCQGSSPRQAKRNTAAS